MFRSRFHLRRANAAAATKCCGSISAGRSLERATTIVFSNRMYQICAANSTVCRQTRNAGDEHA
jgi:hypothetical protein